MKLLRFQLHILTGLIFLLTWSAIGLIAQVKPSSGEARVNSLQTKKTQAENSPFKDVAFRNIGPSIMGGRVVDIEVNPTDPTEFYVAYATGGLWHTQNNGQSFTPIFDKEAFIGIGDIAINWNKRMIWIGTGEVNSSRSSYAGIGVYKSSDNGKTWEYLGLPESHHIGKIQLHPSNDQVAWVGVLGHLYSGNKERGVYKTLDGGKTWKHTLAIDENTGVAEMEINPANPQELYASSWHRLRKAWNFIEGGTRSGIYKSNDGGETWALITGVNSGFPQGEGIGRIGVAVYAKNPNLVYAVVDNYNLKPDTSKPDTSRITTKELKSMDVASFLKYSDVALERFIRSSGLASAFTGAKGLRESISAGKTTPQDLYQFIYEEGAGPSANEIYGCEVYKSVDAGKTWMKTHQKSIGIYNTFGYYFGKIFVSPVDANKVVILGVNANASTDGGITFTSMDKGNTHADWHALWINPLKDDHMIAGNDGGCNITYDAGKNWFKANTPSVGQFYAIQVDNEKPYNVYGGLQDNGSWYGPSNHKESIDWTDDGQYGYKRMNGGDGMQVQVDPRDANTVYTGSQFGAYMRFSKKGGAPKYLRPQGGSLTEAKNRFNWQTPILLSKHNADILYMGGNYLFRSMNKGDEFAKISGDLSNGKKPGDVPFATLTTLSESPFKFGLIYAGTDDGVVSATKDGGTTWTRLGTGDKKGVGGLPQGLYVSRVISSQHKESRVYVTLNGYRDDHFDAYVFVSEDYGNSWKRIGLDLPLEPVNVIREDPKNETILYVGTDGGAYVSINNGNQFSLFTNGLPHAIPVHDIVIQERENEIVLGTHGRSIYVASLSSIQDKAKK